MEKSSVLPIIILFSPWLALLGPALRKPEGPRYDKVLYVISAALPLALLATLYRSALDGDTIRQHLVQIAPKINIALEIDTLGFYVAMVVSVIWLIATIYSVGYIHKREGRYYGFMALCLSFCLGVCLSANMFTLFLFYELMTLFTYPIIIHEETEEARRAGLKYLIYSITAGAVILFAMVLHFYYAQTLNFIPGGTPAVATMGRGMLLTIFAIYMLGFGVKATIMPLHGWVPDAHPAAPAPASAVLSGVILVMGIFGIMRVCFNVYGVKLLEILGVALPMLIVASITIVVASIIAIAQDDLKRRLAYSSVGQMSYIVMGIFLLTPYGAMGGMLHIANHAFMKAGLFLCAGIIMHEIGTKSIRKMGGIGLRLPITMGVFTLASLGMMGVPLTCGFITKWNLGLGAVQANKAYFIIILLVSSLLNAVYLLPISYVAFFKGVKEPKVEKILTRETALTMLGPVLFCALMILVLGIFVTAPGLPYSLIKVALGTIF